MLLEGVLTYLLTIFIVGWVAIFKSLKKGDSLQIFVKRVSKKE